jgi:hypothetical protein
MKKKLENLTLQMLEIEVKKSKQLLNFMIVVAFVTFICAIVMIINDGFTAVNSAILILFPLNIFPARKNYLAAKQELDNRKK